MSGARVVAVGAISALGRGVEAYRAAYAGEPARSAIARDRELESAGFERPFAARVAFDPGGQDRATGLLEMAFADCATELDQIFSGWRTMQRIGLAIGTSSGGMRSAEQLFDARLRGEPISFDSALDAAYFGPLVRAARRLGVRFTPVTQILGACASSTIALGVALRWLELDQCDLVLAGGYDALSRFVAGGFAALGATSAGQPRPFRADRDGMVLGEGAAVVALVRAAEGPRLRRAAPMGPPLTASLPGYGTLLGFGAATDAVHMTAPDRQGRGLGRAAFSALASSGRRPDEIDLVSAHATATVYNDAAEAQAIARVIAGGPQPVVHPFKAQIGHTLGAAGVLETLSALDALARGVAPASAGSGPLDPECTVNLLDRGIVAPMRTALKLSAAFGGANAALVLGVDSGESLAHDARDAPHARAARDVANEGLASRAAQPSGRTVVIRGAISIDHVSTWQELEQALGAPESHMTRLDRLGRLALTAVLELAREVPGVPLEGAGIVVGHTLATLATNQDLYRERIARGAATVEPRRFPATSPNAVAGECAIRFRLTGPSFAVGAGLHGGVEALAVARDLVAAGDADRMLVLALDDGGLFADLARALGAEPPPVGACAALLEVGKELEVGLEPEVGREAASTGPLVPPLVEAWEPLSELGEKRDSWGARELGQRLAELGCRPRHRAR